MPVLTAVGILQQAQADTHRTLTMQAMPLPYAPLSLLSLLHPGAFMTAEYVTRQSGCSRKRRMASDLPSGMGEKECECNCRWRGCVPWWRACVSLWTQRNRSPALNLCAPVSRCCRMSRTLSGLLLPHGSNYRRDQEVDCHQRSSCTRSLQQLVTGSSPCA